jgi:hypothetical protein
MSVDKLLTENKIKWLFVISCILYIFTFRNVIRQEVSGDDWYFVNQSSGLAFALLRYETWSSRVIIEFFIPFFCKHIVLYKIVYTLALLSLPLAIYLVCKLRGLLGISLSFISVAMIPFYQTTSTGDISTSLNYFFPLVGLLWIVTIMSVKNQQNLQQKSTYFSFTNVLGYLCFLFLLLFSCNQEQAALAVFSFSFLMSWDAKNKLYCYTAMGMAFLSIIFIVTCPGNANRVITETAVRFPEFSGYGLFDKLYLGVTILMVELGIDHQSFMAFYVFCLLCYAHMKLTGKTVVLAVYVLIEIYVKIILKDIDIEHDNWTTAYPFYLNILMFFEVLLPFFIMFKTGFSSQERLFILLSTLVSYGLVMIMGFSPTAFASGSRTLIFSEFILIILGMYTLQKAINLKACNMTERTDNI